MDSQKVDTMNNSVDTSIFAAKLANQHYQHTNSLFCRPFLLPNRICQSTEINSR